MRCEFGYCIVCDKEIASKCPHCNSGKQPNGHYTEIEVQWSNGSRMRLAMCKDCAGSHAWATEQAKKDITQAHWDAWDKMGGTYDKAVVVV